MMATAFLGYVLPYGQMSLWGGLLKAQNIFLEVFYTFNCSECLGYADFSIPKAATLLSIKPNSPKVPQVSAVPQEAVTFCRRRED